jgi:hypothetical protein
MLVSSLSPASEILAAPRPSWPGFCPGHPRLVLGIEDVDVRDACGHDDREEGRE